MKILSDFLELTDWLTVVFSYDPFLPKDKGPTISIT